MRTVTAKAINKKTNETVEFELQLADTLQEAIELAGGELQVVELFNRQWRITNQNRHRPRPAGQPQRRRKKLVKLLSPELQALLETKSDLEVEELIRKALEAVS